MSKLGILAVFPQPAFRASGLGRDYTVPLHRGEEVTSKHSSLGKLSRKIERKAEPIIANPKARIGDEAKKRR
jgi:hypothetical protein